MAKKSSSKSQWNFSLDTDPLTFDTEKFDPRKPLLDAQGDQDYLDKVAMVASRADDTSEVGITRHGPLIRTDLSKNTTVSAEASRKKYDYDPEDLSEAGFKRIQDAWSRAYADFEVWEPERQFGKEPRSGVNAALAATTRNYVWQDYALASKKFYNAQLQGALSGIEAGKLQRKQFEQMRKIASEGNEEVSDQRPTGKASVLIGSNIPDRKQKRTSHSRDAGTARAKVKVQAKGINI